MRRYAQRVDANLAEVVAAIRATGCSVWLINDAVDIGIGYGGICLLAEVKDGRKKPSARKLTPAQVKFRQTWTGGIRLITSVDDAMAAVRTLRAWHGAIVREAVK